MPNYMLLLYAPEPADAAEIAERDADLPEWKRVLEEFAANGSFVGSGRLLPVDVVPLVIEVEAAFDQSPGSNAGRRLGEQA